MPYTPYGYIPDSYGPITPEDLASAISTARPPSIGDYDPAVFDRNPFGDMVPGFPGAHYPGPGGFNFDWIKANAGVDPRGMTGQFLAGAALALGGGALAGALGGAGAAGAGADALTGVSLPSSAVPIGAGTSLDALAGTGLASLPAGIGGGAGVAGAAGAVGAGGAANAAAGGAGAAPTFRQLLPGIIGGIAGASGPSGPQTITTTSEPPAYLRPFLQEGVQGAANLFRGGGTPVPELSSQTRQAINLAASRALGGSPLSNTAQSYATNVLGGGFMGSNPYLDATFDRAAGAVTNQIQSNFARSGRNVRGADAAGVAAGRLGDLAASIYGGDYEAERARQQQILPYVSQLANQDYVDIGALSNAGATIDDYNRLLAGQPERNISTFLAQLSGYPGTTQTQTVPTERNRLAGALGGALAGFQLASQFPGLR